MKPVSLVLAVLLSWSAAFAQSAAGLASISGVVRDASGAVVPNARVVVANQSKGIVRNLNSNTAGLFTAPALVPAPGYTVTVDSPGFAKFEARNLELLVGQNLDLPVDLAVASGAVQVEVTAAAPIVEDTKTDVSQVIGTQQIQELPINGRRVDSFVLLTPAVSNDGPFGYLTFRGMPLNNSFLVDGVDNTEQYYNENAGRTRIASQISQDAVQEFQVVSSNMSAEYGRASGGVVNTVTKSGTNALHGSAFWFFRNRSLNARDRYAAINPPEYRHQTGGSIGGPVRKDKLFFFLNTEIQRRANPIASSITNPAVFDSTGKFLTSAQASAGCGAPATAAQCAAINTILPRFFGTVPRRVDQESALGKLDWRPGERNTVSASFTFLHMVGPNNLQSSATYNNGAAVGGNGDVSTRLRNGRVSWTGIAASNIVNEFRFGWMTDRQAQDFDPALQTAGLGYVTLRVAGQSNLGAGYYTLPTLSPNEQRFQFADNLSWTRGRHAMKFGVDIANTHDYAYFMPYQYGNYTYGTITNFALDFSDNAAGTKHWQSYQQTFGNPVTDFSIRDHGFYAQDQFRATPRLSITYGVRYEYAALPTPTLPNPDFPQTGTIPSGKLNFAPRIGLAYSLDKDKTVLRASYGVFHARYSGMFVGSMFTNNAIYQSSLNLTSSQYASGPVFPYPLSSDSAGAALAKTGSTVEFAQPGLRTPYTEQGTLAIERQLANNLGLTVSYLWNRGIQGLGVRDLNAALSGSSVVYQIADASGAIVAGYSSPTYISKVLTSKYQRVLQLENGVNSYYNALAVQLRKRYSKGFQTALSYTWAHAIDYKQGTWQDQSLTSIDSYANTWNGNYKADKGSGLLDQRHRMVISFVEQPTFTHRDGAFYRYVVNNWQLSGIVLLAAGRPQTSYISISDSFPYTGAPFTSSLNGFGGNSRVPWWPTAALYTPPTYRGDARLSKLLPLGERYRVYLNFEAFNITNSVVDTSLRGQAYTLKGGILSPTAGYGTGSASAGFPDGTNARRAQVSARFVF